MFTVCRITDGTTTVDLLHGNSGFTLRAPDGWIPARLGVKGDGVWADNPLSDGRRLVFESFANVVDTLSLTITGDDPDTIAYYSQELARLLEKAKAYWKDSWRTEPVWWEVCANETGMRYATIKGYQTPQDSNPFAPEFLTSLRKSMRDFLLVIEHEPWQDVAPGESTCVKISNLTTSLEATGNTADQPAVSADDASIDSVATAISVIANNSFGRTAAGAAIYSSGIVFTSVSIPPGSTITSATIRFVAATNQAVNACNLLINGELDVSPASFSTYANFNGRVTTTASVDWDDVPDWTKNREYFTPDISSIVQEIVNLPGWIGVANSITIFIRDNTSTNGAYRDAYSLDTAGAGQVPVLYITYTDGTLLTFGQEATCEPDVFVANVENTAQLTHVFYYDSAAAAYSANLIGAALPITLMPTVVGPDIPVVNDILYYGVAAPGVDGGPFWSIVHDIGTACAGLTGVWERWTGAAWAAIASFEDNTASFSVTGVNIITLGTCSTFVTAINGVSAYWVRFRITAAGGNPSPTQVNRNIYTVTTSHFDVASNEITGDIPALLKYMFEKTTYSTSGQDRVFVMTRSLERGDDYTPYIPIADIQTQLAITPTLGFTTSIDSTYSPTGRYASWAGAGYDIQITFPDALAEEFKGKYRVLLFWRQTGAGAASFETYLYMTCQSILNVLYQSGTITVDAVTNTGAIDYGTIEIPVGTPYAGDFEIYINFNPLVTTGFPIAFYTLMFVPVDEGLAIYSPGGATHSNGDTVLLDSCTYPRDKNYAWITETTTGDLVAPFTNITRQSNILPPNSLQRVWVFSAITNPRTLSAIHSSAEAFRVSRYISMRGAR